MRIKWNAVAAYLVCLVIAGLMGWVAFSGNYNIGEVFLAGIVLMMLAIVLIGTVARNVRAVPLRQPAAHHAENLFPIFGDCEPTVPLELDDSGA